MYGRFLNAMVGDRKHDIIDAKKCGIASCGVRFGYAGAGSFGKDEEQQDIKTKTVTIEKGASLTEEQLPSVTPPEGYTFKGWTPAIVAATENATYKLMLWDYPIHRL